MGVDVWGGRLQIYVLAINLSQLLYTHYTQQPTRGRAAMVNNLRTSAFAMQLTGALVAITLIEGPRDHLFPEVMSFFYCVVALPVGPGRCCSPRLRHQGFALPPRGVRGWQLRDKKSRCRPGTHSSPPMSSPRSLELNGIL